MDDRINLGDIVRDTISGYEGVCLAKVQYLTGCDQIGIKPRTLKEDGGTLSISTLRLWKSLKPEW